VTYTPFDRSGLVHEGFLRFSGPIISAFWEANNTPWLTYPSTAKITNIFPREGNRHIAVPVSLDLSTMADILFDEISADLLEELTLLPVAGLTRRIAYKNETVLRLVRRKDSETFHYSRLVFFYTTRL
jgi:hypothetical protein